MQIELTRDFEKALDLFENTNKNVFVTGKAGTGKSTLLELFRKKTIKKVVVLAPTGVAALNVKGQTIHSFFMFKPNITIDRVEQIKGRKRELYRNLETIIVDEISMVRADLLDCIDRFMRLNGKKPDEPFGGCQMIFFGDLYQLPPVVTSEEKRFFRGGAYEGEYFFNSKSFKESEFEFIELQKIFRQKDERFIEILNAIRNRSFADSHLELLNSRVDSAFSPPAKQFYIQLTTTNDIVERLNQEKLNSLKGKPRKFTALIVGRADDDSYPTETELYLKKGAQVMLVNNDPYGRWVNGSIGKVVDFMDYPDGSSVMVKLENGKIEEVKPYTWEIFKYYYDAKSRKIETEVVCSFTQYPMILAWAITIHKSQGKTFDRVIIDFGRGTFAHGQVYVALSRCTSLDGIVLKKPLEKHHVIMDYRIVKFLTSFQYRLSERKMPVEKKVSIIRNAAKKGRKLRITYLKTKDEKTVREIIPYSVGNFEFNGKSFLGVKAFDFLRNEERHFRIDRILEIEEVKTTEEKGE